MCNSRVSRFDTASLSFSCGGLMHFRRHLVGAGPPLSRHWYAASSRRSRASARSSARWLIRAEFEVNAVSSAGLVTLTKCCEHCVRLSQKIWIRPRPKCHQHWVLSSGGKCWIHNQPPRMHGICATMPSSISLNSGDLALNREKNKNSSLEP